MKELIKSMISNKVTIVKYVSFIPYSNPPCPRYNRITLSNFNFNTVT